MSQKRKLFPRLRWLWIWLIQIASFALLSLLACLSLFLSSALYNLFLWLLLPLAGLVSACMATRKGLLNYAAWIAPAVLLTAVHALLYGYAPNLGTVFLLAFSSLVGAAAGEVLKMRDRR